MNTVPKPSVPAMVYFFYTRHLESQQWFSRFSDNEGDFRKNLGANAQKMMMKEKLRDITFKV